MQPARQGAPTPARLLTAEWSQGYGTRPAYPARAIEALRERIRALVTVRPVPGVDHAASIMSPAGAGATAELIMEALS